MITSLHIKNFRGFEDLEIKDLKRVNLFAGKNNTGKTSVLEALFLLGGPNNLFGPAQLRSLREHNSNFFPMTVDDVSVLFHRLAPDAVIDLEQVVDGRREEVSLMLREVFRASLPTAPLQTDAAPVPSSFGPPLMHVQEYVVRAREGAGAFAESSLLFGQAQRMIGAQLPDRPPTILMSSPPALDTPEMESFSHIEELGQTEGLVRALQEIDPRLKRLVLLAKNGATRIYGDLGLGRLLPLSAMGDGAFRLLAILLAIARAQNGAILIDDVDSGLHHTVREKTWAAIGQAAEQYETQVFATTHSLEMVRAAHAAFRARPKYELTFYRLERVPSGVTAVYFDQQDMESAEKFNFEVR